MSYLVYLFMLLLLVTMTAVACKKKRVNSLQDSLVIVGASAAGTAAIKALLDQKYSGNIVWIADQKENPYLTTKLPSVFEQSKSLEDIGFFDTTSLPNNTIRLFDKRVVQIKPEEHVVVLNDGKAISYRKLLLALGMQFQIPLEFQELHVKGIFTFGRYIDIQAIDTFLKERDVKRAVIVGFGLTGADVIDGLAKRGIQTHIVQRGNRLLDRYVNDEAEAIIRQDLEMHGIQIHAPITIKEIIPNQDGYVQGVVLNDGTEFSCDMIIFTTGIALQEKLLKDAGIKIEQGGIWVDDFLQTNQTDIFAAGDGVLITDITIDKLRLSAKWPDAQAQGAIAARNMVGATEIYKGSLFVFGIRFFDTLVMSCGPVWKNDNENYQYVIKSNNKHYSLFLLKNNILKGFLLVNPEDRGVVQKLRQLIEQKIETSEEELNALMVSSE